MSYKIITNKIGSRVVLKVTGNTNISVNALSIGAAEVVTGATLTQLFFTSSDTANSSFWRANTSVANNNILRLTAPGDYFDFTGVGISPDVDLKSANVVFVVPGTETTIVAEFHKDSTFDSEY